LLSASAIYEMLVSHQLSNNDFACASLAFSLVKSSQLASQLQLIFLLAHPQTLLTLAGKAPRGNLCEQITKQLGSLMDSAWGKSATQNKELINALHAWYTRVVNSRLAG
jgi:hypothetical protein